MSRRVLLLVAWLALALGAPASRGGEELAPAAVVSGTVLLDGKGVPARVHLTRRGDIDPLYNSRWQLTRTPATAANELALELGATVDEARAPVSADASGGFSFGALPAGGYVAWAEGAEGRLGAEPFDVKAVGQRVVLEVVLAQGPATLRGRIAWANDEPYRGPVVLAQVHKGGSSWPLGRCETDAQGRWSTLGNLDGELQLVVVAADGTVATSPVHELPGPTGLPWTLDPDEERKIRGRVLASEDGAAIGGAIVEVERKEVDGQRLVRSVRSGPDGTFALSVRGRPRRISALAEGFRSGGARVPAEEAPITLQLGRRHGAADRVAAKDSTQPVSGVRVLAYKLELSGPRHAETTTDATGHFAFPDLAAAEWMVFVLGDGWVSDGLWKVAWQGYNPFTFEVKDRSIEGLAREVVPAGRIDGRVVDDAGKPVVGALIEPRLRSTPVSDERPLWAIGTELPVASGRDGTFSRRNLLPEGLYSFRVTMPGFPELESEPVLATPAPEAPLTLRLSSRRWLRVVVRDSATGAPVVGAKVEPFVLMRWGASGLFWSRTTDADGAVSLGPLPAGEIAIEVNAADYEHPSAEPLPVPEAFVGSDRVAFPVRLERGRTLEGRATFPEGAPRSGFVALAYRQPSIGNHDEPVRTAPVNEMGSFRLHGLRAADYVIVVREQAEEGTYGGWTKIEADATTVTVEVARRPEEEPSEAKPEPAPPSVDAGQRSIPVDITTPRGEPLRAGFVEVPSGSSSPRYPVHHGRARIAVPPGATQVMLRFTAGEGWDPEHRAGLYGPFDAASEKITLQLAPARVARGRVLDSEGKAVAGVRVSILPVDPLKGLSAERYEFWYSRLEARTDAEGRYAIGGLRDGDYEIAFAVPPEFILPDLARFKLTDEERVLRLRRGVEVAVRVLDDQGKPYAGAEVQARRLEGDEGHEHWQLLSLAHTDRDGVARLVGLDAELPYRLMVNPDADRPIDLDEQWIYDWKPAATTVTLLRKPPAPR